MNERVPMRIVTLTFYFALLALSTHSQTGSVIDVQHYRFQIDLSDVSDSINGKAEIKILFTTSTDGFTLDLASVADGKGMTVTAVEENKKHLDATQLGDKLVIKLPTQKKNGDTSTFVITYKGIPSDGLIISKNKYGHRTFFADNWPNRGHNWIPCHDDPADKASVEFIVTAPEHYQVVANGIQVEETNIANSRKLTHWKEETPVATKVMVIGVAGFAVSLSGVVNGVPVYTWVYPEDRDKGFFDYAQAPIILPFFMERVGPYGYKKLANVESKTIFGGLENANTIFYSEKSITGTRSDEDLLVHEIAHQWFGNMATEKSFAHLWLSEGFATYFTILYFENKYGPDTARQMRRKDREEIIDYAKENNHPVVDTAVTDYMQLLNANSYQKGSWVLHMLRKQLGDSIFWKGIREYYATYAGKNADTGDFLKIVEKVSGTDLHAFFTQWLYTPGLPKLTISLKVTSKNNLLVTVTQLQKTPFAFPLEIALQTRSGKTKIEKLAITKKDETFPLTVSEKIIKWVADPDSDLLFEGPLPAVK